MTRKERIIDYCQKQHISWFDFGIIILFFVGGYLYLSDMMYWSISMLGEAPYGDAGFWWEGALNVAHGIFQDNPGKGFRPGYFLFTGLTLPVLGMKFQQYFIYFLLLFLTISSLFYLSLRHLLGRWVSACAVAMGIFNPFTAEWLATSTTDATGLILNMAALSCLVMGLNKNLRLSWLIGFGLLFALGTLTRPLVTPFVGVVLLTLLMIPRISFQKKLWATLCVCIAFCLPTFLWMTIQKLTIDRWAISSNDASAFYGASHPDIQVWNPNMYEPIQKIAANHFHIPVSKVNDQQLNHIFWLETYKNYELYADYHLKRLLPHIWKIAQFSPAMARYGTDFWQNMILSLLAFGFALVFLAQKKYVRAFVLSIIIYGIYKYSTLIPFMIVAGVVLSLIQKDKDKHLGMFLLSVYWLIGVIALFFVGGTFGKPSFSALFALNALGYRLGTQIFFVGNVLACYFIFRVAYIAWKSNKYQTHIEKVCEQYRYFFQQSSSLAGGVVAGWFVIFFAAMIMVYSKGSYLVIKRAYALSHDTKIAYPDLTSVTHLYKEQTRRKLLIAQSQQGTLDKKITQHADILFTGTVSPIIWNILGQERSKLNIYTQNQIHPYTMGPQKVLFDLPQLLSMKNWSERQGAFVIRDIPDKHNDLYSPFHQTAAVIRAFFPLTTDKKHYDLEHAVWFPLVKNATQLDTSGELSYKNVTVNWMQDIGLKPFQRRFFIVPTKSKQVQLLLNTSAILGPATLNFSYAFETDSPHCYIEMLALAKNGTQSKQLLHNKGDTEKQGPKKISISIPKNVESIQITFNNVPLKTKIWFYEFNVTAKDFRDLNIKHIG